MRNQLAYRLERSDSHVGPWWSKDRYSNIAFDTTILKLGGRLAPASQDVQSWEQDDLCAFDDFWFTIQFFEPLLPFLGNQWVIAVYQTTELK